MTSDLYPQDQNRKRHGEWEEIGFGKQRLNLAGIQDELKLANLVKCSDLSPQTICAEEGDLGNVCGQECLI